LACITKREADERAKQAAHERRELRIKLANIPERYSVARFEHIAQASVIERWLEGVTRCEPGSLVVLGPVGTGKTYLACALARAAAERGIETRYESVPRYLREIRDTWGARDRRESQVFRPAASVKLLVLDEIGAGVEVTNDSWRVHELVAERYDRALPTVFVSNLRPDELKAAIGDRAYDRMRDESTQLNLLGLSRRKARNHAA
jgi:DNA replication protein DnaC